MTTSGGADAPGPRKNTLRRWALQMLRYGLCVVAVFFLYRAVTWYDYVHLNDAALTEVRLLERHGDQFVVWQNGQRVTKAASEIHYADVEGHQVPDIRFGLATVVLRTNHTWALWSILMFAPVTFMCAVRLTWMLRIQDVQLSFWNAAKLTFAGNFFNFALPGSTGGDVIKAYYITRFTHKKTEAVTTIFLDRAVGLLALVLIAGALVVFTRDPSQFRKIGITVAVICGALAVGSLIVFSGRIRRALRLKELVARLPMGAQLQRVGSATLAMRRHKLLVSSSLLITIGLQGLCMVSAAVMAWAMHMKQADSLLSTDEGSLSYYCIYVAIGFLIAAIPIAPPQAVGVLEYFYVKAFTAGGVNTPEQAVALAVGVRLIQLVWALPGVLVPLLGAHLPSRAELAEIQRSQGLAGDEPAPSAT